MIFVLVFVLVRLIIMFHCLFYYRILLKINSSFIMTSDSESTDPKTPPRRITRARVNADADANASPYSAAKKRGRIRESTTSKRNVSSTKKSKKLS